MSAPTPANSEPVPAPTWSSEARTWASLILFFHLFAVFLAISSYTSPSGLQRRLHELFAPYLRTLHLTANPVSYPYAKFHLSHASVGDVNFTLEVDVPQKDGSTATIAIPPEDLTLPIRYRRYQALANASGNLASGESDELFQGILPKAILGSVFKQHGATEGTIRMIAHGIPNPDTLDPLVEIGRSAGNTSTIYEAQAFMTPNGVELLRKATTLEVAPANTPGARPETPNGATPKQ